jgi:hypothetical protein
MSVLGTRSTADILYNFGIYLLGHGMRDPAEGQDMLRRCQESHVNKLVVEVSI